MKFISKILQTILLLLSFNVLAQSKNTPISILVISNASSEFNDRVLSVLSKFKGLKLIDNSTINKVELEKERQKGEQFINGYIVEQGKMTGANYIFENSTYSMSDPENPFVLKETFISKLIDVKTGVILGAEKIDYKVTIINSLKSLIQQKDFRIELVDKLIVKLIVENFDFFKVEIVKPTNVKGEDVNEVLLFGGKLKGVQLNQKYIIYEIKEEEINGFIRKEKIQNSKLRIEKVEDDNFSLAKVISGESNLFFALKDKRKLICDLIID